LRVKSYILKQPPAWSLTELKKHQRRSKSVLEKAAYRRQPRNCPLDTHRRSCLLVLQSDSRLGFPHRRFRPHLCHTAKARLQLLLLLQILHHGFRETSRLILRTSLTLKIVFVYGLLGIVPIAFLAVSIIQELTVIKIAVLALLLILLSYSGSRRKPK
jgi:hypothetical protein